MNLQYVRAFIVLVAGLIALIVNIKTNKEIVSSLFIVLVVIIVFYFIATLIVEILHKAIDEGTEKTDLVITSDEDEESEEKEEVHVTFDDEDAE